MAIVIILILCIPLPCAVCRSLLIVYRCGLFLRDATANQSHDAHSSRIPHLPGGTLHVAQLHGRMLDVVKHSNYIHGKRAVPHTHPWVRPSHRPTVRTPTQPFRLRLAHGARVRRTVLKFTIPPLVKRVVHQYPMRRARDAQCPEVKARLYQTSGYLRVYPRVTYLGRARHPARVSEMR